MTTDLFAKRAALDVDAAGRDGAPLRPGQGRGDDRAGLRDDALLRADRRRARAPRPPTCCSASASSARFERITVDGQLSTNDTVLLQASGASRRAGRAGVRRTSCCFGEALDALLRQLALEIVADGEGASGSAGSSSAAATAPKVERVARAIANSPLVKTALHGGDPNWGRIVQAAGHGARRRGAAADRRRDRGRAGLRRRPGDRARRRRRSPQRVQGPRSSTSSGCPATAETEVFFSDLGHEYIRINAEYTT